MVRVLVEAPRTGRRLGYEVDLADLVNSLMQEIEEAEGVPASQQLLRFGVDGPVLNRNRTFQSYNIDKDNVLYLNAIHIIVRTLTHKNIRLMIHCWSTILELKQQISETGFAPVDQQRLIFHGKQLNDERRSADYEVLNGSTIHIVLRLRGGGYEEPKAYGIVLFDWDGNMPVQDDKIHGLPLIRGEIVNITNLVHKDWFDGRNPKTGRQGKFPRNRVEITKILDQALKAELENLEEGVAKGSISAPVPKEHSISEASPAPNTVGNMVTNDIPIPALPAFPYPSPAPQSQRFTVPLGEKGFSFVQVIVYFLPLEMPAHRARVKIVLQCLAAHPRRISSPVVGTLIHRVL